MDEKNNMKTTNCGENGDVPREKKKKKSMCGNIRRYLMEFCSNTTIHGLKYLGEEHRPLGERLCWLLAFVLSLAACGHLIREVWIRWDERPVIVSFAEQSTPLWQVPFPAITICSEIKFRKDVVNFTSYSMEWRSEGRLPQKDFQLYQRMALLCELQHLKQGNRFVSNSVINFFEQVGPTFREVVISAKFKSNFVNATELFSTLLTEEGICYTFNMLEATEMFTEEYQNEKDFLKHGHLSPQWSLDEGYSPSAGVEVYPNRALGSGSKAGINLVLKAYNEDLDHMCMGPVQGFKVLLHNPAEIPRVREQFLRVPLNQELVVRVIPSMMTTSEGLRSYSPHRRQCYFPSERHLRFFKVYTQSNCALECVANFTMQMCGCVAFYMPRSKDMPICGSGSINCLNDARDMLLVREVEQGVLQRQDNMTFGDCDCLQACTGLGYEAETSQANLDWQSYKVVRSPNVTSENVSYSRLSVAFKDMQFITSRRSELYGQTDFLANCGGLLGLFMGFSILSLVEIFYYMTLRICCVYHWTKNKAHILTGY